MRAIFIYICVAFRPISKIRKVLGKSRLVFLYRIFVSQYIWHRAPIVLERLGAQHCLANSYKIAIDVGWQHAGVSERIWGHFGVRRHAPEIAFSLLHFREHFHERE